MRLGWGGIGVFAGLGFWASSARLFPLDRLAEDGQLLVDKSHRFRVNPGADPDEQYSQSVLKV